MARFYRRIFPTAEPTAERPLETALVIFPSSPPTTSRSLPMRSRGSTGSSIRFSMSMSRMNVSRNDSSLAVPEYSASTSHLRGTPVSSSNRSGARPRNQMYVLPGLRVGKRTDPSKNLFTSPKCSGIMPGWKNVSSEVNGGETERRTLFALLAPVFRTAMWMVPRTGAPRTFVTDRVASRDTCTRGRTASRFTCLATSFEAISALFDWSTWRI